jgi:UPF0755 protein
VSGYGPGGYPGQGYDDDPGRARQRPGERPRGGPAARRDPGNDQGYDDRGHRPQEYGGYDPRGYDQQGPGGYSPQGAGPQPGQYGRTGGTPQYDRQQYDQPQYDQPQYDQQRSGQQYDRQQQREQQHSGGPRRPQGGHPGRGQDGGYDPRGRGGRRQRDPGDWDDDSDSSFLPGFDSGRDGYDYGNGRYAQERGDRYGAPGDAGRGAGGRGPGPRDGGTDDRRPVREGDWDDRDDRAPGPRKKATRWVPRIFILAVVAVLAAGGLVGGLYVYHRYEARYHPADYAGPGTGDVVFQVMNGDTSFSIAPRLYQMGIIASERAFENAATAATTTASTSSAGLEAGYYNLHLHMQASLAYAALTNPKNAIQTAVTIPEGKRVSQVLTILAAQTKIPLSQFEAAARETAKLGLPSYAGTTVKLPATVPYGQLEGYLFPATYTVTPHETALQILQAMVARYNVEAQQLAIATAARSVGLTPAQLIIEASMVQAEAGLNSDMPKMASVINNRKAAGMADGFDSVVLYGLGQYGINITEQQAVASGLYDNTQKPGLPPTPIDNPGDAAIQAVLHPAKTDYLYFLTVSTGKPTEFSHSCQNLPGTC